MSPGHWRGGGGGRSGPAPCTAAAAHGRRQSATCGTRATSLRAREDRSFTVRGRPWSARHRPTPRDSSDCFSMGGLRNRRSHVKRLHCVLRKDDQDLRDRRNTKVVDSRRSPRAGGLGVAGILRGVRKVETLRLHCQCNRQAHSRDRNLSIKRGIDKRSRHRRTPRHDAPQPAGRPQKMELSKAPRQTGFRVCEAAAAHLGGKSRTRK